MIRNVNYTLQSDMSLYANKPDFAKHLLRSWPRQNPDTRHSLEKILTLVWIKINHEQEMKSV